MSVVIRGIVAVVFGTVVGGMILAAVEALGHRVYPPPPGMNPNDPESIRAAMAQLPMGALLFVLLAWAAGAVGGGWLAALIARRARVRLALLVGALLLAGGVFTLIQIPHPLWFQVVGVLVFLPAAYLGARVATGGGKG